MINKDKGTSGMVGWGGVGERLEAVDNCCSFTEELRACLQWELSQPVRQLANQAIS